MKVILFSGSPRRGNCEIVVKKLSEMLSDKSIETEVVLLREKNIPQCEGCVEYCNHELICKKQSDMQEIMEKMKKVDKLVFVVPSYFSMPPGLFKNFIDMTSVIFTEQEETKKVYMNKKTIVIGIGAGELKHNKLLLENLKHYVTLLRMDCIGEVYLVGKSENPLDHNILNTEGTMNKLEELVNKLC